MSDDGKTQVPIDEHWLADEIKGKWGEFGAHMDIYREVLRRSQEWAALRAENERLEVYKNDLMSERAQMLNELVGLRGAQA